MSETVNNRQSSVEQSTAEKIHAFVRLPPSLSYMCICMHSYYN